MPRTPSVLFIGAGSPWNGGAGYLVRQDMLLRALARITPDLHLAMFDLDMHAGRPPFACDVTALPEPRRLAEPHWRSLMNDVFSARPMGLRTLDCDIVRAAVQSLHPEDFDAVVAYRCDFAYMAGVLDHHRLLLDIDDPEHLRRADAARTVNDGNHSWQRLLDLRRLRRFELTAAQRASACFVCQANDARAFGAVRPIVVPNCVTTPKQCPSREATTRSILFVGNLTGARQSPNVDALLWFLRQVWPLVRSAQPGCEFRVAGPIRDEWRAEAEGQDGVRVLGFVDDLPSVFCGASMTVAPIRFGTGTRIKILESMAWGCPVVSTAKGCEGIDAQHQRHLIVADQPKALADACTRVLSEPGLATRLAGNAWQLVTQQYDRERQGPWLTDLLRALISGDHRAVREAA